jgi:ferric-dicitrate binding protein FerR (iron transport regulator)
MTPADHELIERFVDDALSAEQLAEFERRLESDPALADELAEVLCFQGIVRASVDAEERSRRLHDAVARLTHGARKPASLEDRIMTALERRARRRRASRPALVVAATGGIAAAVAAVWFMLDGGSPKRGPAGADVVARAQKCVRCSVFPKGRGTGREARAGVPLREGDRIQVAEGGRAVLAYSVRARMELGERTDYELRGSRYGYLERGALAAEVATQPPGMPFVVKTPHARVEVVGTRFRLRVEEVPESGTHDRPAGPATASTRLDVHRGLVRMTRLVDDRSVDVEAGSTCRMDATVDRVTVEQAHDLPAEGRVRLVEDHEGPLAWASEDDHAPLSFQIVPDPHRAGRALRVVYEPEAGDPRSYRTIIHPFTLEPGDRTLRLLMRVDRYEKNATWTIQFQQRDRSCWYMGDGMVWDLEDGWTRIELKLRDDPWNTYGGGVYRPSEVRRLLFALCVRPASIMIDDLSLVGEEGTQ